MFVILFSLFSSAQACTYQLNQIEAQMGDRSIFFGDYLRQKIQAKGYVEAEQGVSPDYLVDLKLNSVQQGHFEHARAVLNMTKLIDGSVFTKTADTRCYTQSCIAKDGAKVIRKSIDDFGKDLPVCQD